MALLILTAGVSFPVVPLQLPHLLLSRGADYDTSGGQQKVFPTPAMAFPPCISALYW